MLVTALVCRWLSGLGELLACSRYTFLAHPGAGVEQVKFCSSSAVEVPIDMTVFRGSRGAQSKPGVTSLPHLYPRSGGRVIQAMGRVSEETDAKKLRSRAYKH